MPTNSHEATTFPVSRYAASLVPAGSRRSLLHEELLDFAWRCSPTAADVELADLSAKAIELAWRRCGGTPPIQVIPFGSQPCGLALPGGDLDVYVNQVWFPSAYASSYGKLPRFCHLDNPQIPGANS